MPGAGHIVHMPPHIYLRTGRSRDASLSTQQAAKVDAAYFAGHRAQSVRWDGEGRCVRSRERLLKFRLNLNTRRERDAS